MFRLIIQDLMMGGHNAKVGIPQSYEKKNTNCY